MAKNLLLITADATFTQVLRHGLEHEGYRVHTATQTGEAVVIAEREKCDTAFIDLDLGERRTLDIGQALRALHPNIGLVLFTNADSPPALDPLRPWTLQHKPYYLPEILTMLNNKPTPLTNAPAQTTLPFPWLQDVNRAAQHLTRLTLESSAQAALITRANQLWAYAGGLSQSAANELAVTVTRHWDGQKGSDLLRFVRLEATKAEHMLYATRLADDVVLALVFDAETPFSTIRSQAGKLADSLSLPEAEAPQMPGMQKQAPVLKEAPSPVSAIHEAPTQFIDDEEDVEENIPSIADILLDVPSPTPAEIVYPTKQIDFDGTLPSTPLHRDKYSRESSPALRIDSTPSQNLEETAVHHFDATVVSKSVPRRDTPVRRPQPGELDETRPHSITEVANRVMLDPITPGLYNLTYACLLVPRFTTHHITGDLSERLSEWLPQISIAFGWRLEYLAVRPEYVQWVLNVPPSTAPGYLMRIMRQKTSDRIFAEFPRIKKENPSGDFWAPGYLIMGGTQPHPPQLVQDYIKQTRTRQGYEGQKTKA